MEKITIDERNKKKIYEHIQGSIGYYREYEKEIEVFNADGTLDRELATRILENLIYSCKVTKLELKPNEEFKEELLQSDELFDSIPKDKDYDETTYVRDTNVEVYGNMQIETIYSNLQTCLGLEQFYQKIHFLQNLRERATVAISSINSIDEHEIEIPLEDRTKLRELGEDLDGLLSQTKTDEQSIQRIIQLYNVEASKIWNSYLSNENQQPRWLVHNLSRGAFEGDFDKKYMSASLVTSKTMGLFSESNGNNFGFIIKPKNIISASEHDTFTNNSHVINEYMETFQHGNTPPIKLPWEIEEKCVEQTIENCGEMLNYDNRTVYSEIVVDEFEIEAMYYRSNGEGDLAPNYETAKRMAEERGVELKELDISKARDAQGLEPMTEGMQKQFLCNILRKSFMSEEQISMHNRGGNTSEIEQQFIESHYKEFYQRYLQLRNNGEYTREDILQEFYAIVSDKEMEEINNFYSQKKEEMSRYETYSQEESHIEETEEVAQQQEGDQNLWTNRFKGWYGAIDRIPESTRAKFIKMKSDIVKAIKGVFKEKNSPTQENAQEQSAEGR